MMFALTFVSAALALLVLLHGVSWTLLGLVALRRPRRESVDPGLVPSLAVVVPAHNEELLIGACLESILGATYPLPIEVVVVADNSSDRTAAIARDGGVTVLQRDDETRVGKSYALDFALAHLAANKIQPDAVVFIDADSEIDAALFEQIGHTFASGADAVQGYYRPAHSGDDLGQLRDIAFGLVHWARPLGMSRLGLGSGIKGNGFALRWQQVERGLGASGLAEDASLTVALARRGVAVKFVPRALLSAQMASGYSAARTQDERWERGRLSLLRASLAATFQALRRRRLPAAAGALDVASLPLSLLVAASLVSLGIAAVAGTSLVLSASALGSLVAYVAVGSLAARQPLSTVLALRHAPRFLLHKLSIYFSLLRRREAKWQRTQRNETGSPTNGAP
jgi:1,2-diacylglycerol 3-beta-glucosyltransferase